MIGVALVSLLVGLSGALIPGPLFAVTLQQALLVGWTAGLWLTVGHTLAEIALVGTLRVGLGTVLQHRLVTRCIGLVGGAVLLFIAWSMFVTARGAQFGAPQAALHPAMSAWKLVGTGLLLTVANPTWYIWWSTAGVGLIAVQSEKHGTRAWPAFFLGHSLADYLWYLLVSVLVAFGGAFLSAAVHRGIIQVCAAGVALLGLAIFIRPLAELKVSGFGFQVSGEGVRSQDGNIVR